jgi:hypothetical protein
MSEEEAARGVAFEYCSVTAGVDGTTASSVSWETDGDSARGWNLVE